MPRLPAETIDAIVDHLHDDRSALAACSLASSAFIVSARHHLFSEVVLECSHICPFLKLLDVPSCTITAAITRVIIRQRKKIPGWNREKSYYVPMDTPRLVSRLQGVRYIRLSDISLSDISPPLWLLLHDLKGVKEMEIHHITFETPEHFFRYICSLPALESLSVLNPSTGVIPDDLAQYRPKVPFCIPLLDVGKLSHGMLGWFLAQDPIPPVHTFCINLNSSSTEIEVIRQYSEAMGSSIQNLHINLPTKSQPYEQRLNAIDFGNFPTIRSVHFEGSIGQHTEPRVLEDLFRKVFSQIGSTQLRKVSVSVVWIAASEHVSFFGIPDHVIVQSCNWGRLPEILQCTVGDNLEELRLAIQNFPQYQQRQMETDLRKLFSTFHLRDVFHFDFL